MNALDPSKLALSAVWSHPGSLYAACYDPQRQRLWVAGDDWAHHRIAPQATRSDARGAATEGQTEGREKGEPKSQDGKKAELPQLTAELSVTHHSNYVSALRFSSGVIISASYDGQLVFADAESGRELQRWRAHRGWLRDLAVSPDGRWVVSVGDDCQVKVWDVHHGTLRSVLRGHDLKTPEGFANTVYTVDITPDGTMAASGERSGVICLWDLEAGELAGRIEARDFYTYDGVKRSRSMGGIRRLRFSPDSKSLAVSGIGAVTNVDGFVGPCRVEVWDWQASRRTFVGQDKHKAILNDVVYHPLDANWLVAAGGGDSGGVIAWWNLSEHAASDDPQAAAHKLKPKGHIQQIAWDLAATRLFAAGYDGVQVFTADKSDSAAE